MRFDLPAGPAPGTIVDRRTSRTTHPPCRGVSSAHSCGRGGAGGFNPAAEHSGLISNAGRPRRARRTSESRCALRPLRASAESRRFNRPRRPPHPYPPSKQSPGPPPRPPPPPAAGAVARGAGAKCCDSAVKMLSFPRSTQPVNGGQMRFATPAFAVRRARGRAGVIWLRLHPGRVTGGLGIIVVLASLLLPSVRRVREQAKQMVCCNNLRRAGDGVRRVQARKRRPFPHLSACATPFAPALVRLDLLGGVRPPPARPEQVRPRAVPRPAGEQGGAALPVRRRGLPRQILRPAVPVQLRAQPADRHRPVVGRTCPAAGSATPPRRSC